MAMWLNFSILYYHCGVQNLLCEDVVGRAFNAKIMCTDYFINN